MRIDEVVKIAKEKYPDIEIYQRGGDYSSNKTSVQVIFGRTKGKIKVYHFNVTSYVELLTRLGFNVIYKKDVEAIKLRIKHIREDLDNVGKPIDFFEDTIYHKTDAEIEFAKQQIAELQNKLDTYIRV